MIAFIELPHNVPDIGSQSAVKRVIQALIKLILVQHNLGSEKQIQITNATLSKYELKCSSRTLLSRDFVESRSQSAAAAEKKLKNWKKCKEYSRLQTKDKCRALLESDDCKTITKTTQCC